MVPNGCKARTITIPITIPAPAPTTPMVPNGCRSELNILPSYNSKTEISHQSASPKAGDQKVLL
jgi:hypothetical protein